MLHGLFSNFCFFKPKKHAWGSRWAQCRNYELWAERARTGTGLWDWQLCPDLDEGLCFCLGRWQVGEMGGLPGRSCPIQSLQTLPGELLLAGRSHVMVTAALVMEGIKENWMQKAQHSGWDPELCSQAQFTFWLCHLGAMWSWANE